MREQVPLEVASIFAGIIALSAFERLLTRMRENVALEVGSLFARIVALSAFKWIHP